MKINNELMKFNINELRSSECYADRLFQLLILQSKTIKEDDFSLFDEINTQFKETAIIHALLSGCSVKLEDGYIIIGGIS